jgi:hypothetical protein
MEYESILIEPVLTEKSNVAREEAAMPSGSTRAPTRSR